MRVWLRGSPRAAARSRHHHPEPCTSTCRRDRGALAISRSSRSFLLILFFGIRGLLWRSWPGGRGCGDAARHLDSTSGTDGRMRTSVHPRRRRETRHSHERDPGRGRRATDCRNLQGLSGACRFQGDHRRQWRRRIVACPAAGSRTSSSSTSDCRTSTVLMSRAHCGSTRTCRS